MTVPIYLRLRKKATKVVSRYLSVEESSFVRKNCTHCGHMGRSYMLLHKNKIHRWEVFHQIKNSK